MFQRKYKENVVSLTAVNNKIFFMSLQSTEKYMEYIFKMKKKKIECFKLKFKLNTSILQVKYSLWGKFSMLPFPLPLLFRLLKIWV